MSEPCEHKWLEDEQPFEGVQRLRFCRDCRQVDVWHNVSWVDFDDFVQDQTAPK